MNATPQTLERMAAKLLDGTISDGEYKQLEQLVETHPEFARNVTELVRVDGLLKSLRHTSVAITPGLLESVEHSVSAMITSNAAAVATGAAIAGKTIFGYIAGAVGVAAIAGVSYWAINSSSLPQNSVEVPQVITPTAQQITPAPQTAPQQNTPQTESSKEIARNQPVMQQPVAENAAAAKTPVANDGSISAGDKDDMFTPQINRQLSNYNRASAANDMISAADYAKKLGVLYYSTGNIEAARQYFGYAFAAAKSAGMTDFLGDAHGQMGLLEMKAGNSAAAKEHLEKAVQTLNGINAPADKWQKELDGLNAPKNK